jgi:transposase-like protein
MEKKASAEKAVREIRRKTRRRFSAEEKIRVVIEGLRGEESIASLCRREGIAVNLDYRWSREFLDAQNKGAPLTTEHGHAALHRAIREVQSGSSSKRSGLAPPGLLHVRRAH